MHWLCCFEPLSVCVLVFRASSDAPAANIRKCSSKALDMLSRQIHCHCCLLDHHHCLLHHSHPHDLISLNAIMCNLRTIIMASISVATMIMPVGCLQMEWAPAGRAGHPLRASSLPAGPRQAEAARRPRQTFPASPSRARRTPKHRIMGPVPQAPQMKHWQSSRQRAEAARARRPAA